MKTTGDLVQQTVTVSGSGPKAEANTLERRTVRGAGRRPGGKSGKGTRGVKYARIPLANGSLCRVSESIVADGPWIVEVSCLVHQGEDEWVYPGWAFNRDGYPGLMPLEQVAKTLVCYRALPPWNFPEAMRGCFTYSAQPDLTYMCPVGQAVEELRKAKRSRQRFHCEYEFRGRNVLSGAILPGDGAEDHLKKTGDANPPGAYASGSG